MLAKEYIREVSIDSLQNVMYNQGNKLSGQLRKTALSLTPQAMYNQFKRPSAEIVSKLYYIYRKT